jgi:hypothetical protein
VPCSEARTYQAIDQPAVWVQEVGTSSEWMPEALHFRRHRSRAMKKVPEPGVHAESLGSTEPSEAAGNNIVHPRRTRAQESVAVISRSVALVIPDRRFSKRATWPMGAPRNNTWTWSVAKCTRQSCWRAVPGRSLSREQRDRRADAGRGAISRHQHSSTNSIEK